MTLYVVAGLTRSGTTLMMRSLEAGGLESRWDASRNVLAREIAEKFNRVLNPDHMLHEIDHLRVTSPGFYNACDGLVIKCQAGWLVKVLSETTVPIKMIWMKRDLREISESSKKFLLESEYGQFSVKAFEEKRDHAFFILDKFNINPLIVSFKEMMTDPLPVFNAIAQASWPINPENAARVVDPNWYRIRIDDSR